MYYIAKVKVEVITDDESKNQKFKNETYLVAAESVTDAEAVVHENFSGGAGEFIVKSVSESPVLDVLVAKK